jgi:hypothetical protein
MSETLGVGYRILDLSKNAPRQDQKIVLNNGITLCLRSRKADEGQEFDEYERLVMQRLQTEEGLSIAHAAARSKNIQLLPIRDHQAKAYLNWSALISAKTVADETGKEQLSVELHYSEF